MFNIIDDEWKVSIPFADYLFLASFSADVLLVLFVFEVVAIDLVEIVNTDYSHLKIHSKLLLLTTIAQSKCELIN